MQGRFEVERELRDPIPKDAWAFAQEESEREEIQG